MTRIPTRTRAAVREILRSVDPSFHAAYKLLRATFPQAEMLPAADWKNAMRERAERLWTDVNWHLLVATQRGRVIAAATGMYLGNVNVGVVGYIAVHPKAQSRGLGPRLRDELVLRFRSDARDSGHRGLAGVVGEVRERNPWLRRLVERDRAIALDFPYFQPSLGGKRKPVPLVLYYQPVQPPRTALTAPELKRLLYTVWRRGYRVSRPLDHAVFRRMLRSLDDRRRIGSRALPRPSAERAGRVIE